MVSTGIKRLLIIALLSLPCAAQTLPIAAGGTGQTTRQAAFDGLAPVSTVAGTVAFYDGSHWVKLDGNTSGTQCFQETSSGVPSWAACGSGSGTVSSGTTDGVAYYTGSTTVGSTTPPTVNGFYQLGYNVTGAAAVAPTATLVGLAPRGVGGTTSTDTVPYSDAANKVVYGGSVAVAVTLPTPTTLANANFYAVLDNVTSGSGTAVTVTPTTWTINGSSTLAIAQGQSCILFVDPNVSTNWRTHCGDSPLIAGTNVTLSRTAAGVTVNASLSGGTTTIANGTATLGTSAISSGACATVVTVSATGTATTDNIMADFNADPTSTTGYSASASGMLTIIKYPTANNVNFKVCNNTSSSITPGAATLNWRVVR